MIKFIFPAILALLIVGCGTESQVTNNPETPKPTQAQLDSMPPEASGHASAMSDYAKAQGEMNKNRVAPEKR